MNQLKIFRNNQFGELRMIQIENEAWLIAKDVCSILGLKNVSQALSGVDDEDKSSINPNIINYDIGMSNVFNENTIGFEIKTVIPEAKNGGRDLLLINESGFYTLVLRSNMPMAKQFRKWVTSEVLPTIRQHGAYMNASVIEKALTDPDTIIQLATNLKEERRQKEILQQKTELQSRVIEQNTPKVEYFEEVLQSESTYNTTQIAKELGMGAPTLNRKLKELRVQYMQNGTWVLYEKYQNKGYTKTKTHTYKDNGVQKTSMLTVWTEKGRHFIHSIFNSNRFSTSLNGKMVNA